MVVDWIGFCYAVVLAFGGVLGYSRKGSLVSLAAGLFFGFVAAYGALCITYNSRNVTPSFFVAFIMAIVMGVRYRRSRKVMPAGIVAGLSLFMILRLVCMLL
ncbi:transmembrane protein 14A [Pleurodeles waltl]|uniref:transmembrane protein 14A n=1 Tax=Pleurodeles waltl TaxID=8319 RepID=UPI00370955B7